MDFNHIPVMLNETINSLNIKSDGIYVDCTLGGAGHSSIIAEKLTSGKLIGIDRDVNAIEAASKKLSKYDGKFILCHSNFSNIRNVLKECNIDRVDGVLLDLGVSSHQLDEAKRGFSYMQDAPLDMRMDNESSLNAKIIVNNYSENELRNIIFKYGEEKWASRIAEFIIKERKSNIISTTFELVEIIKKAIPASARRDGPHPAKRTFQAIRIAVNDELSEISNAIPEIIDLLNINGRLSIITFHSLEDRIVKNAFRIAENPCTCPPDFPQCICNKKPQVKIITRKPIIPSEYEIENNPRSRSAKLRVVEKI